MLFKIFFPKAHPTQNVHPHLAKRTVVQGFYLWQTFLINCNNHNRIEKVTLAGKCGFMQGLAYRQTKQAYRTKTPLLSEENLKSGALDSNFALRNKVEKVESACHGWHQLKRLLPDQAASAKYTPKYRIANYKLQLRATR